MDIFNEMLKVNAAYMAQHNIPMTGDLKRTWDAMSDGEREVRKAQVAVAKQQTEALQK